MAWAFQGVANAGIQILLIIGLGYVVTARGLFAADKFLPQVNTFLLLVSFPALNLSSIGIRLDLRDEEGWRALAAYMLWIAITQVGITVYVLLFTKRDLREAGLLNLLLVANNTVIMGLPIMDATWGAQGRYIALLTGVSMFLQVMPYSIAAFEMERWALLQQSSQPSVPALGKSLSRVMSVTPRTTMIQVALDGCSPPAAQPPLVPLSAAPPSAPPAAPPNEPPAAPPNVKPASPPAAPPAVPQGLPPLSRVVSLPQPSSPRPPAMRHTLCNGQGPLQGAARPAALQDHPPVVAGLQPALSAPTALDVLLQSDMDSAALGTQQYEHANTTLALTRPGQLPPGGGHLTLQQVQDLLRGVAELQQQRKQAKRRRRERVSVVDVPLPFSPRLQLGQQTDGEQAAPWGAMDPGCSAGGTDPVASSYGGSEVLAPPAWHEELRRFLNGTMTEVPSLQHLIPSKGGAPSVFDRRQTQASAHESMPPGPPPAQQPPTLCTCWQAGLDGPALRWDAYRKAAVQAAVDRHGGVCRAVASFLRTQSVWGRVITTIAKNPMLWSLLLAVVVSTSGLRVWLDPSSPDYIVGLGWVDTTLFLIRGSTVPLALFSNGVFLSGKRLWQGNMTKAFVVLVLKVTLMPGLQLACAKLLGLSVERGMALVLLSVCPCAATAFVVASQYNHGAEIVTLVTIVLTVLLVPVILAALNLPSIIGVYSFDSATLPLP